MAVPDVASRPSRPGLDRGRGPGWPRAAVAVVVIALAVLVVVVAMGWTSDDGPRLVRAAEHQVAAGQPGVTSAQLEVVGGTDTLRVTAADLGDDLVRAQTPPGARAVPVLEQTPPGQVIVGTQADPAADQGTGPVALTVTLDRDVLWSVRVNGGTQLLHLDLSQVRVRSVDITQGVATVDAALPPPDGIMVTRISGGASAVRLHLPASAAARFTFSGGAGSATVDSQHQQGIPAGTMITSDGWSGAPANRIEVALDSGIGSLVADRYRR